MPRSSHSIGEPLFPYDAKPEQPEDGARREEYRRRLAEYLTDPAFRAIEGFPIGSDEDILALSDPPYYTACPNPFLPEILEQWQAERRQLRQKLGLPADDTYYRREPFAADVSEGKNDPIYNAHSYHTKVPHKAIMRYILHYTDPGDIVFDGFCGTGMTGVAAQLCGNKAAIEALGYTVKSDGRILDQNGKIFSRLGVRKAALNDLSPAATFISHNYNSPINAFMFEREAKRILKEVEDEFGWMYETWHPNSNDPQRVKAKVNYIVWSDVFACPQCGAEMTFWNMGVDQQSGKIRDNWNCSRCGSLLGKKEQESIGVLKADRGIETFFDRDAGCTRTRPKIIPVLVCYSLDGHKYEKEVDRADFDLINKINELEFSGKYPTLLMMFKGESWGDTWRSGYHMGISYVYDFYTRRNLMVLDALFSKLIRAPENLVGQLRFTFEQAVMGMSKWARYVPTHYSQVNQGLSGTLYIGSQFVEVTPTYILANKIKNIAKLQVLHLPSRPVVMCMSSKKTNINSNIVDYIFIDPPFGDNLIYSELNFLLEAWLKVITNNKSEAIISNNQRKGLSEYQQLMKECFIEFYRILKPGRWITIEFHNSKNSVWNSIQEALLQAGFILADVRTLDKQQETFKQLTSSGAVKQDLVISCYKPTQEFEKSFTIEAGNETGGWLFIKYHLEQLPLPNINGNIIEYQTERMPYLLYDRLVAFHLVRGLTVPYSAGDFYSGLSQRFLARDGMYFTASQAAEYDRLRLKAERVEQLALFVVNEDTAIQWLRQTLDPVRGGKLQTYSDLQPEFLKQLHQEKHEKMPELLVMLEQNFLQDESGRWYAPDPDKQADLDAMRAKVLMHEFADYFKSKGKLKVFRSEAVRAGFSKAWKERDYETIVKVGERLPEDVLQEDPKLKMYYDNALSRYQRGPHQEAMF